MLSIAISCTGLPSPCAGSILADVTGRIEEARLIHAGHVEPSPGWHIPEAAHRFHELIVVVRGAMRVRLAELDLVGSGGDILYYRAGVPHEEWSVSEDPVETFFVAFELADGGIELSSLERDREGRVRQIARWLHEEWHRHSVCSTDLCRTLFHTLLLEQDRLSRRASEPRLVEHVREFIRERIDTHIDLDMLARASGLSRYYFARQYKRLTGRTPMDEVRAERVRCAHHLIVSTNLPMKDVAARSGLCDEYHLYHLIRRYLDATPSEIRASMWSPL